MAMKRKVKWRTLKFTPTGGEDSISVSIKSKGFMSLCEQYRYRNTCTGFSISDTKGLDKRYGWNNLSIDWSDFREALIKHQREHPPEKPKMFHGERFPPDYAINLRKRLLASVCREYISPESLAEDLLEWLARGRDEDVEAFLVRLLQRVGWVDKFATASAEQAGASQSPPTADNSPSV